MKRLIFILSLLLSIKSHATDYYIKTGGSDSANGLSDASAWGTISKVNSFWAAGSFAPGDRIYFRRGDTFKGTIIVAESGTPGNPILIGAYGTGAKPVLSGLTEITGWTAETGGIYSKAVTVQSAPNMVLVNGVTIPIGRFPDSGYLTIDSHTTNTTISDSELNSNTLNWTGARVVIRKNDYIIDRSLITAHSGNTLTYKSSTDYEAGDGWGYFIQNDLKTLTSPNEWYYGSGKFYMFFGTATPSTRVVKISTVDKLIVIDRKAYITIENLHLQGANLAAISVNSVNHITVQNCDVNYSGFDAIYLNGTSSYFSVKGCNFNYTNSNVLLGEYLSIQKYTYFGHNVVRNTGTLVGMFRDNAGGGVISEYLPTHSLYEFNKIDTTAYIPISFKGDSSIVRNNFVNYFCFIKDDGGGIYTWTGPDSAKYQQRLVKDNIVINAVGAPAGRNASYPAEDVGIYMDNNSSDVTITGNTVAFCGTGILLNGAHRITMRNNTLYGNKIGFEMVPHNTQPAYKNKFTSNLIARTSSVLVKNNTTNTVNVQNVQIQFSFPKTIYNFGALDSNYYSGPDDNSFLFIDRYLYKGAVMRTFNDWKTFTGKESKSAVFPTSTRFDYNPTASPKTIALSASYKDVKGKIYSNSYVLPPFSSAVLMPYSGAVPTIPSCISIKIENIAPSIVDMNFDLTLANIIPAPSAFMVSVNSTPRTIKSVSVSGTHVFLTLENPVVYGDAVNLTYTEPSTNKLQGISGGIVAAMTNRQVINNLSAPVPEIVASIIQNSAPSIIEISYSLNLANIVPPASAFSVRINSISQPVNTVTIAGNKVLLTLANSVSYSNIVTVAYTKPATNPIQSAAGQQSASTGTLSVTNNVANVQAAIPEYVSSIVHNNLPDVLEIAFNMNLAGIVPPVTAFAVTVNSFVRSVKAIRISDNKVFLTLSNSVSNGDVVTVAYSKPSTNPLQSVSGQPVANINAQMVTNNVENPLVTGLPTDLKKTEVKIFPNPARESFAIHTSGTSAEILSIRIYDLSGKLRLETRLDPLMNDIQVQLTDLRSGIYIVHIQSGHLTLFTQQLIVY